MGSYSLVSYSMRGVFFGSLNVATSSFIGKESATNNPKKLIRMTATNNSNMLIYLFLTQASDVTPYNILNTNFKQMVPNLIKFSQLFCIVVIIGYRMSHF